MGAERQTIGQVSGWLTVYSDGSVDRSYAGPPNYKFMSDPVPPHQNFIEGVSTKDVLINSESNLRVRVYLPDVPEAEKLPIILHFHGGGFCITQADWFMFYNIYTRVARESKAIVVSTYLSLAPENRLPAAINDAYSSLLWLRDLASHKTTHDPWLSTKGDFNRVFLIGDSSGANIVHQIAKMATRENQNLYPLRLVGAIPVHPVFVRSVRSKSELEKPQTPMLRLDMMDKFLSLGLPEGSTKDHPITCPMGEDLQSYDLPPYLLCVAEDDIVIDTVMEFYEGMKKAGKDIELLASKGVGHSFYINKLAVDVDPHTSEQTKKLFQGIAHFVGNHN